MSVFVLAAPHIDVLAAAGKQWGVLADSGEAVDTGQTLADANLLAYLTRYPDTEVVLSEERPYTFTQPVGILDPVAVLKAADCYRYQVDGEATGPGVDRALAYIEALRAAILAGQPALAAPASSHGTPTQLYRTTEAYSRAPWEITDSRKATRAEMGPHPHDGTH